MLSSRMNPIVCNDSDGVIKDQQIGNMSIECRLSTHYCLLDQRKKVATCVFTQQAIMALKELAHVRK